MLSATDIRGMYAIIPTPAKADAYRLDATHTVDLDETARVVDQLIADGVSGVIALGTTGECATLTQPDYEAFASCVLETVNRRIPTFIGATALGSQEAVRRTRFLVDLGADGTLLGLPMWQPLVTASAVKYYRDFSEYFPSAAIMIYANARAFRFSFPVEFWQAVSQEAPTVIAAKYSRPHNLAELIAATHRRINFVPNEMSVARFNAISPETTTAAWATAAAMGPSPAIAIMDAILKGNQEAIDTLAAAIAWATEPVKPIIADPEIFASFNIQLEKARINEAGYCRAGPNRPPYDYMPAEYDAPSRECGRRWAALCQAYEGNFRFKHRIWE